MKPGPSVGAPAGLGVAVEEGCCTPPPRVPFRSRRPMANPSALGQRRGPSRQLPAPCECESTMSMIGRSPAMPTHDMAAMAMRPLIRSAVSVKPYRRRLLGGPALTSFCESATRSLITRSDTGVPSLMARTVGSCSPGSASSTASASAAMKRSSRPRAGTRRQRSMPSESASSRYSTSISSSVSMCSDTKEMGTTTRSFTPAAASSGITSSVYGSSHLTGPTRLW
mmetsp:Transcript_25380/g.65578  ORF Transcript_25380/g.65578 Transcript_25380/m.65578 type:complete len:225 (+) Transcript_25380:175-849(+)